MVDDGLIHVASGQLRVGRRGEVLSALLGSCVAVGMLWPRAGRCGLAHCLLPIAPGALMRPGARYVDHAIPSLIALMGIGEHDLPEVQVILVGGASMLGRMRISSRVGVENVAAAHALLARRGVTPVHVDTGGRRGRQIRLDCTDYSFAIKHIDSDRQENDFERA